MGRRLKSETAAKPGEAGSIEQHLDMAEKGPMRGEEQLRTFTEHPNFHVDESDPPFFIAHSTTEKIPLAQSERFVEDLRRAGIDVDFLVADGTLHSIALLDDDLKARIVAFYARILGPGFVPTAAPDAAE